MILITGGMGFIGIQTARALAGRDDLVLGYHRSIRSEQELKSLIQAEVETVRLDVPSPYSVNRAVAQFRPDSIIHLAVPHLGAMPPAEESLANMQGLRNVLEAAVPGAVLPDELRQPGAGENADGYMDITRARRARRCSPVRHPVRRPPVRRLAARTRAVVLPADIVRAA